jgi:phage tail-like protein
MEQAPGMALERTPPERPALAVAHAADTYRRYPGEPVTFYTRVDVLERVAGLRLQVSLDPGFSPGDAMCSTTGQVPRVAVTGDANHFLWEIDDAAELQAGQRHEFTIEATVMPAERDGTLSSRALVSAASGDERTPAGEETVNITVTAKGRYLAYLPAFYEEDELMGRFLMLFESFWAPLTTQAGQMAYYFDPKYAPADMLPWLASWIGLNLDERWPEDRRRLMLSSAVTLFRRRGTKRGLQEYLEVFTGRKPQIIEHGANNFRLGPDARLGPSIALGTGNRPHTFQVILSLPPISGAPNEAERNRLEEQRRRMITAIIDAEKPAHTEYPLQLTVEDSPANGGEAQGKA